MGAQAFGRHLAEVIRKQAADVRQSVGRGSCSSIENYKAECGKAKGLEDAAAMIEVELKKLQTEDV